MYYVFYKAYMYPLVLLSTPLIKKLRNIYYPIVNYTVKVFIRHGILLSFDNFFFQKLLHLIQ